MTQNNVWEYREADGVTDRVEQARGSFERRAWGDAFAELSAAHREGRLEVEDLKRLAVTHHREP
jgi:hypothetical protein